MSIAQSMLPEFDQEMANTRKTLERVPDDKWDWKPHPKSGSMGWLTNHIATMPGWAVDTLTTDSFDFMPGGKMVEMPNAKNRAEALAMFDKGIATMRTALTVVTDAQLMQSWSLLQNGTPIITMPRVAILRGMIFNHMIHHRAQLTVYFRLNDIAVPGLYGPSADEAQAPAAASA
ncbi:MAG TPA: DinB family protein [Methylomirabilota bacterium]|jgi:uncharacterized damage-inducible protein DinB|nr:DinB family protein [Methylomirabilota bacterium]